mmetsp:Transcript_4637/g.3152  ORF Transcript_4637/g.3152 Transcript_4637/m.3152 type:complete len:81 (+) Transcript_4637:813-1055(+)
MSMQSAVRVSSLDEKIYKKKQGLYFCAPECFESEETGYTYKADIYSVGILFYYIISGGHMPWTIPKNLKRDSEIKMYVLR